ncbi:MAG: hypothetical protein ACR2QB_12075, partial [Gammaproteobacteria bacterium]
TGVGFGCGFMISLPFSGNAGFGSTGYKSCAYKQDADRISKTCKSHGQYDLWIVGRGLDAGWAAW